MSDKPGEIVQMRACENCVAGGDDSEKPCERREDTGIPNWGAWLCDECYQDWRNTPEPVEDRKSVV